MIELVIFDCDGVLADSEVISSRVLIEELANEGIEIDADYVRRHFLGRSFPTVAKTIRENLSRPLPVDFEMRYRSVLLDRFETELRPTKGVEAAIKQLAVARCVATSSSPVRAAKTLKCINLSQYFGDHVYTASQVGRGKPAPDLFLFSASQMGSRPEHTLVIEDSLPGLLAARAAGMQVLAYCGGEHLQGRPPETPFPVETFDNWADFPQVFSSFNQGLQQK